VDRFGLTLPPDLAYSEWQSIGRRVNDVVKSAMWCLGDFLAYGVATYGDTLWGGRVPTELYERLAEETGYSVGTLQNARSVCARIPRSRRRENVTYAHAQEIVGRCKTEQDIEGWLDYVSVERPTTKALRERLRTESASSHPEPADIGVTSFLETARQFSRDYASSQEAVTPVLRNELRKILAPVLRDLS
jgi:hypothetical protein